MNDITPKQIKHIHVKSNTGRMIYGLLKQKIIR